MGILGVHFDKINLKDDDKFLKHDPDTIIHVRLLSWRSKFEKRKLFKDVSKELIPVTWHPKRWWDLCFLRMRKKEVEPIFTDEVGNAFSTRR